MTNAIISDHFYVCKRDFFSRLQKWKSFRQVMSEDALFRPATSCYVHFRLLPVWLKKEQIGFFAFRLEYIYCRTVGPAAVSFRLAVAGCFYWYLEGRKKVDSTLFKLLQIETFFRSLCYKILSTRQVILNDQYLFSSQQEV